MVTQLPATSLSGHGFPLADSVGVCVRTASTTQRGVDAIAVAMATTAAHPCPSAPPTRAHVRVKRHRGVLLWHWVG